MGVQPVHFCKATVKPLKCQLFCVILFCPLNALTHFKKVNFLFKMKLKKPMISVCPKNSLNTCIKKVCVGTEPCTLTSIFDMVELPPEQQSNVTPDMSGFSESCYAECNVENAIHSLSVTHVRTEKLEDVYETFPKKSRFVPPPPPLPIEEVLAALDRLSSRDQAG